MSGGLLSVLFVMALGVWPMVIGDRKPRDQSEAVYNARQIGRALMEFENRYGALPNDSTRHDVKVRNPSSTIPLGSTSSNDYFRQLLAAGIEPTEAAFYANAPGTHRPDNVILGARALGKGECGFAYVLSQWPYECNPPIAMYPMVRGHLLFNHKVCKDQLGGKAVILLGDGSVMCYYVDESGHITRNGKDLFDPTQPFWGGKVPVVKWPE